jgi:hypothetical protein
MPSSQSDLEYLDAALGIFEDYLLSKEIFWQIGGQPPRGEQPFPSLTLGGMLLAQARLNAKVLTGDQQSRRDRLNSLIDAHKTNWRSAWEKKARAEHSARLNLWRNFLEEYRENPEANADRYPYEVSRRVMLDLLEEEGGEIAGVERELVRGLDRLLDAVLIPGDFVWGSELEGGFPRSKYRYLYGRLKR